MAWRAAMVLIAFLALAADHQYCSGNTEMTLKEQCETRDFQLTTAPSNTFVVPNKANKFNFNKRGKCVVTSRFKCNFGYGFTTDDGMTWAQRIKFELDGSDWIIQNDCIKITTYCPEPDSVLNGIQADSDNNGRALGSTRTFRCEDGYKLKAGNTASIRCTENMSRTGLWTQLPVCEGITCENPGQPTNGQATNTGFDFGKTVRYTCNQGYEMENIPSGVLTVACKGTGLWSQAKPTCQQITTYCPEPDSVLNGIQADSDNNGRALGSTRTFRCEDGYKLKAGNTASIRCTENMSRTGLWTQLPVCEGITCGNPGRPENGQVTSNGFDYGKTVRYACNRGYKMQNIPSGVLTVTCTATRQWSQGKPTCLPRQCPIPGTPTSGQYYVERLGQSLWKGPFQYDDIVRWVCDTGFTGNTNAACRADSTWSKNTPTCTRISCQDQRQLTNGDSTSTGQQFGSTVTYRCHTGFYMVGSVTAQCMSNKRWSHNTPTCLPRTCPDPVSPSFGHTYFRKGIQRASLRPYLYNDTVTWICNIGYSATGPTTAVCQATQTWSNNRPDCQRITCGDPGRPENGRATTDGFDYGKRIVYTCDLGYKMQNIPDNTLIVECEETGQWSQPQPTCLPRQCPVPGTPTSGQYYVYRQRYRQRQYVRRGPFQYGDIVKWVCDTGFTGNTSADCRADGTWSKNTPTCTRISCPDPSAPTNGDYTVTGLKYEDTVTYTCRLGYDMQNHPNSSLTGVCMANMMWSRTKPTCENIRRNSSSAKLVTRIKQEVLSTYGSILQALSDLQVVVTNSAQKMLSWS
ncbi:CUB and sushi domain-containing protein 3-like isoform X4 [Sycon ciliatum]|uniref:CUB and sushi domain-containing protein 3-like isoform X4 n=1 Tax=Sycon ciliatum TaxID=27933 RepID=UPI0031F678CA